LDAPNRRREFAPAAFAGRHWRAASRFPSMETVMTRKSVLCIAVAFAVALAGALTSPRVRAKRTRRGREATTADGGPSSVQANRVADAGDVDSGDEFTSTKED